MGRRKPALLPEVRSVLEKRGDKHPRQVTYRSRGRLAAVAVLDKLLSESVNQKKLYKALQREFDRNPVKFFRQIVMPLLPRESKVDINLQPVDLTPRDTLRKLVQTMDLMTAPAAPALPETEDGEGTEADTAGPAVRIQPAGTPGSPTGPDAGVDAAKVPSYTACPVVLR